MRAKATNGYFLIDKDDAEKVSQYSWWVILPRKRPEQTMVMTVINKKMMTLHKFLMHPSTEMVVDHINHNRLDNRRKNLRICTRLENARNKNKYSNNKTGFKGVCFDKNRGKYMVTLRLNNKTIHGGRFTNKLAAAKKYNELAKVHFGSFAVLNKVF